MPYRSTSELPDWVRQMPKHAQEIYLATFNSALKQYGDEEMAARVAIEAVKQQYKKSGDRWLLKEEFMENLIEHFDQSLQEAVIDRENNIIRNVCMIAPVSKNNRRYTEQAMRSASILFEGVRIYANHPKKSERGDARDVRDLIGKGINMRLDNGKVKGDLEVLKHHSNWVFPLAEQTPELVGNSFNGQGKVFKDKSGEEVVEDIIRVNSVDLVADPATTRSLFEQTNNKEGSDMDIAKLTLKELLEGRPDLVAAIEEKVKKENKDMGDKEKFQARVTELEEQVKKKDLRLDELETRENLREKEALVDKLLKESKLQEKKEAITPKFREILLSLEEKKDDKGNVISIEKQIKEHIADREAAAFHDSGKIKGMGGEKDEEGGKQISDEDIKESVTGKRARGQIL